MSTIAREYNIGQQVWCMSVGGAFPALYSGVVTEIELRAYTDTEYQLVNTIKYTVYVPALDLEFIYDEAVVYGTQADGLQALADQIDSTMCS